jgi:drug/metabolite transporter (DMT)-like permease
LTRTGSRQGDRGSAGVGEHLAWAWAGLAYVAAVSMFGGFVAWYRGLALGGVARVGQLRLVQPVLTLAWSAALLAERVDPAAAVRRASGTGCWSCWPRCPGRRSMR